MSAAFVITAIYYIAVGRSDSGQRQRDAQVAGLELISTLVGSQRWPSLSPDDRLIAYVAEAAGTPQVWVRNLRGGNPSQITFGDLPAMRPLATKMVRFDADLMMLDNFR
jgi:Tol biopolymer transport system component